MHANASVAVLGLGNMGRALANALIDAGLAVTVWNRTPGRAAAFDGRAAVAETAADAMPGR